MIRLDPGEELLFLTRRHPLLALGAITAASLSLIAIFFLAPVVLDFDIAAYLLGTLLGFLPPTPVASIIALGLTAAAFGVVYLAYRRDIVVVTTRRLVHRSGLLRVRSSETAISRIGDILIDQGVLGRALDYGDVKIVAGSESGVDLLLGLRAPNELASALRRATTSVR